MIHKGAAFFARATRYSREALMTGNSESAQLVRVLNEEVAAFYLLLYGFVAFSSVQTAAGRECGFDLTR